MKLNKVLINIVTLIFSITMSIFIVNIYNVGFVNNEKIIARKEVMQMIKEEKELQESISENLFNPRHLRTYNIDDRHKLFQFISKLDYRKYAIFDIYFDSLNREVYKSNYVIKNGDTLHKNNKQKILEYERIIDMDN